MNRSETLKIIKYNASNIIIILNLDTTINIIIIAMYKIGKDYVFPSWNITTC